MPEILVDPEDEWLLRAANWNHGKGSLYLRARFRGRSVALHRVIMDAQPGELVDHRNHNVWDCRRANLRKCDRNGSNANRRARRDSKAPYKGITQRESGRWLAQIMANKTHHRIGLFDTPEEAAAAYDREAVRLHGEFASINGTALAG